MKFRLGENIKTYSQNLVQKYWETAERDSAELPLETLRQKRVKARMLRHQLSNFIRKADDRLTLPNQGANSFPRPHNSDWAWRPALWRTPLTVSGMSSVKSKSRLGDEVSLFHDCTLSEVTLRQLRNTNEADLAPYGLRMDVFKFAGSFLSLVIDLPPDAVNGLNDLHLLRVKCIVEMEKKLGIFVRLNIKNGPNIMQIVRELPLDSEDINVEFDLYYSKLDYNRLENAWIDIIFDGPEMNQVILRDVTFSRRIRADM